MLSWLVHSSEREGKVFKNSSPLVNYCFPLNFFALLKTRETCGGNCKFSLDFVWYLIISEMSPFCYPSETLSRSSEVSGASLVQINSESCVVVLK